MYQTSGWVDEHTYKSWKEGGRASPTMWCGDVSGPDIEKITEAHYLANGGGTPGKSVYIFCRFGVDPGTFENLEKYKARREYFGWEP